MHLLLSGFKLLSQGVLISLTLFFIRIQQFSLSLVMQKLMNVSLLWTLVSL